MLDMSDRMNDKLFPTYHNPGHFLIAVQVEPVHGCKELFPS